MTQKTSKFKYLKMSGTAEDLPEWISGYPDVNTQVKSIREFLGISQEQLAENVGLTWRSIPNIENGKVNPKITTLKKIAEYFNCELKILIVPKKALTGKAEYMDPVKRNPPSSLQTNLSFKNNKTVKETETENDEVKKKKEYFWD